MNLPNRSDISRLAYDTAVLFNNPTYRAESRATQENGFSGSLHLAARALMATHTVSAPLARSLVTRSYRQAGEEIVGLGYHTVVLEEDETMVRKIHHRTAHLSSTERLHALMTLERRQERLLRHYGDIALLQTFEITSFPPSPRQLVISSIQEKVEGKPVDFSAPSEISTELAERAAHDLTHHALMPDIVGVGNFFETTDGVRLVDTIPLECEKRIDRRAIALAIGIIDAHGIKTTDIHEYSSIRK